MPGADAVQIKIKRIYEVAADDDGMRILVDRLWPRGVSKEEARIDRWDRDIAPSTELRKWFKHEEGKWDEFKKRYFAELSEHESLIRIIREEASQGIVTLLFATKETERNNATALREYLLQSN